MLPYSKKVTLIVSVLSYFITNDWEWEGKNVDDLQAAMSDEDKKVGLLLLEQVTQEA